MRKIQFVTLREAARRLLPTDSVEDLQLGTSVEGAFPNGSRVHKVAFEPGDFHPVGAEATVVGSVGPSDDGEYGYEVRWDDHPARSVFVRGRKLGLLSLPS